MCITMMMQPQERKGLARLILIQLPAVLTEGFPQHLESIYYRFPMFHIPYDIGGKSNLTILALM